MLAQFLEKINEPARLKKMTPAQLEKLAKEIRTLIIETTAANGGHLASSLGAVELTLALYGVFDAPRDKIIWDVGHQSYAHKIITGRRDDFRTIRKKDGLAGFPKRSESEYDAFGTGHASTSVSAALGFAIARDLNNEKHHVITVIGDGALTGGEAFEALNNAGDLKKRLIVVLNDNEMSIAKNVGAMSEYLNKLHISLQYGRAKKDALDLIKSIPRIGGKVLKTASDLKDGARSLITIGGLFEEMGFRYIGPADGHDIALLKEIFSHAKKIDGPVLIHVNTKKGKGYRPAEISPEIFHGVGKFDVKTGKATKKNSSPTYTEIFGETLAELAETDKNIVAITAAMPSGTGLKKFGEKYPRRFFDVGIAEEHAITMAAGLAAAGKHPVAAIYSTFMQRAYDQLIHDVCLQNLPVTLCLDRAGIVGEDGPTHHGVFDLSYLRTMPNMSILAPKDGNELRKMIAAAVNHAAPTAIRYPRGAVPDETSDDETAPLEWGRAETMRNDGDIAILAVGSMAETAVKAADLLREKNVATAVVNMRFVKPLDEELLAKIAAEKKLVVTVEENVLIGGFGAAVAECFADKNIAVPLLRIGINDAFVPHGARNELLAECGLTPEKIAEKIRQKFTTLFEK